MIEAQVAKIGAKSHTRRTASQALGRRHRHALAYRRGGDAFRALAEAGINIQMISTSEIKISVIIGKLGS
jgi:aspartokinase